MRLTVPQIIMYNHASWVNHERSERSYKHKSKNKKSEYSGKEIMDGKTWEELDENEQAKATDFYMTQL